MDYGKWCGRGSVHVVSYGTGQGWNGDRNLRWDSAAPPWVSARVLGHLTTRVPHRVAPACPLACPDRLSGGRVRHHGIGVLSPSADSRGSSFLPPRSAEALFGGRTRGHAKARVGRHEGREVRRRRTALPAEGLGSSSEAMCPTGVSLTSRVSMGWTLRRSLLELCLPALFQCATLVV